MKRCDAGCTAPSSVAGCLSTSLDYWIPRPYGRCRHLYGLHKRFYAPMEPRRDRGADVRGPLPLSSKLSPAEIRARLNESGPVPQSLFRQAPDISRSLPPSSAAPSAPVPTPPTTD
ncbi:hypothetical protein C8J57DRAFT_1523406 [Mycena rebaudengoi]|nr:hypothetical protein C8J57DRAFT_1523406 [Mycena rebaudengoi]